jgi:energy-coupling factor transporter transmembrane protein EcfT
LGSFIADVLQPLAPFSKYIFFLAILLLIIFRLLNLYKKGIYEKFSFMVIFFWLIALMSGAVYLVKKDNYQKNGLFANIFPTIKETQNNLGIIEKDLVDIKSTTKEIKKETQNITKKLENIEKKIDSNQKIKLDQTKLPLKYTINFYKKNIINIFFQPVESPREFYLSTDGGKNFNSLGFLDEIDQRTGLNLPKRNFSFSSKEKNKKIQIKYLDINSVVKGPFNLNFDLIKEFKIYQKKKIKNEKNKWVQINNYSWSTNNLSNADPSKNTNIYGDWNISFLLENRCALKSATIKLDNEYYMKGLDFDKKNHVSIINYENSFKEKKIMFPNCDLELKNYDFKDDYKPSNYITKSSYKTTDSFTGKEIERSINLPSEIWEKRFSEISINYSDILDLLKYEDMNLQTIYNDKYAKGPLKEIAIRLEYFDGESSIFEKFANLYNN